MAITRIKISDLPQKSGNNNSWLKETNDWKELLSILAQGLKPQEAIVLDCPIVPRNKKEYRAKLFARAIRIHLEKLGLKYDCWAHKASNKVYIVGR